MSHPVARSRHLLAQARREVEGFTPGNPAQRHLQGLLLSMILHMGLNCCQPGEHHDFARWWGAVQCYRQLLTSPVMASRRGRTVLAEVLATPWPKVQRACTHALRRRHRRRRKPRRRKRRRPPRLRP
ncbi:MAG: hypothetical protein GY719_08795 [bacterium]|nr:hypothetical protein [bacterium]